MTAPHTPGPWAASGSLIVRKETVIAVVLHSSHTGAESEKRKCRDYDRFAPKWTGEADGNALLLALAPELAASLRETVAALEAAGADGEPGEMPSPALDRARLLLARLDG